MRKYHGFIFSAETSKPDTGHAKPATFTLLLMPARTIVLQGNVAANQGSFFWERPYPVDTEHCCFMVEWEGAYETGIAEFQFQTENGSSYIERHTIRKII